MSDVGRVEGCASKAGCQCLVASVNGKLCPLMSVIERLTKLSNFITCRDKAYALGPA